MCFEGAEDDVHPYVSRAHPTRPLDGLPGCQDDGHPSYLMLIRNGLDVFRGSQDDVHPFFSHAHPKWAWMCFEGAKMMFILPPHMLVRNGNGCVSRERG